MKGFPSAVTDAEKSRFADFEVPVRKLGHVGPSFHEYSLLCVVLQSKVYRVMDTAAYKKSCMEGEMHHPKLSLHVSLLDAIYPILIGEGVRMLVDQTTPADNFMVSMTLLSQVGVSLPGESILLQLLRFKLSTQVSRAFLLAQQKYAIHYQPNFVCCSRPSVWTRHA